MIRIRRQWMRIQVEPQHLAWAHRIVAQCRDDEKKPGYTYTQKEWDDGGDKVGGKVLEAVCRELYGIPLPSAEDYAGYDMQIGNFKSDTKNQAATVEPKWFHVGNFRDSQMKNKNSIIVFGRTLGPKNQDPGICILLGWCAKPRIRFDGAYYPKGTERERDDGSKFLNGADNWELEIFRMNPMALLQGCAWACETEAQLVAWEKRYWDEPEQRAMIAEAEKIRYGK